MSMFKNPENLLLLLLGMIWLTLILRNFFASIQKRREAFANEGIFPRIVGHKPTKRPVLKWGLIGIAFFLMGLSLARPTGGLFEEAITGSGLDLVVLFDVSQSMEAMDIEGHSRLEIGKALVEKLAGSLKQDRLGLVAFAGDTMVQCPLTQDKNTFLTFLQRIDPSLMTTPGTDLAKAIETGIDRFDLNASQSKAIVLVSDGEDQNKERLDKALKEAKRKGIVIFTIGVGSQNGAPIPVSRNVWGEIRYKSHQGRQVVSKLNDATLKNIGKATGGQYFRAADGKSTIQVSEALGGLKRVAMNAGTQTVTRELFHLPGLLAFLILLFEWMISERIPYEREKDHWLKRI